MPFRRFALHAVLALSVAWGVAKAETAKPEDLKAVEDQIRSSKSRQSEMAKSIEEIAREAQAISDKLVAAGQDIQGREAAIESGNARVGALKEEEITIRAGLAAKEEVLSELLAGLQRLERNPPPALVVEPGDILSALRGAMLFGAVVPELEGEARALARKLARLESIKLETAAQQKDIRDNIAKLEANRDELKGLQKRKKDLLASQTKALKDEKARAAELASKAKDLKQLLAALEQERIKREADEARKTAAAAAEKKRIAALAAKPRIALANAKGRLDYPAQGKVVKRFGDQDGFGGNVKGQFVETVPSAQVVAPVDGKIEFAGAFRSYGQLLILNAGNGYHVLLAGMGQVSAETGQIVRAGEPLAAMGEAAAPGTLTGDQVHSTAPVLYIEFRKNGEAIDSAPWWIGGLQEARG